MIVERIICLLLGYALGNFQTAYIIGRLHHIDIREYGSHNSGTTNALRVMGRKTGLVVLIVDILKCGIAIGLTRLLFGSAHGDIIYVLMMYAVTGTILGHNFPVVMGFKGGKGVACTAGIVFFYHPYMIPAEVFIFFAVFFTTHFVSLSSLLAYAGMLIQIIILGQNGFLGALSAAQLSEIYGLAAFLTVMAYWKHRENIQRLLSHTERKTYLSKKNKAE
ncbi:MAG: glycerol-3-phosphate 1-O-acyltransferase PlsY [Lachnospiraceae bacterium]|nr:glycerol-3-phosphate 1-O-acyltransferase PlsY [Lachnospiraceae bacterium]